ncbi:GNAT family N-acetyltransferase [Curtobacterium sp. VKM Ac-1393]|uniref:GNAT family N-acetyltransferase n=1 Tax=Curtobacterium sp. VKM Ac-1393 TaxID=2783814 RepID=UPI00188CA58B|nr:GNAT family N-acetyltransferase [Curtobacterium sp. VKM Ac-1393]MBF4607352.1 GNAT family N-acetyltransferase [Curtobacterium sp. VKM Ac-1393]
MIESSVVVHPATPDEVSECVSLWVGAVAARDGVPESDAVRERAGAKFAVARVALLVAAGVDGTVDGFALVTAPGTGEPTDPEDAAYLSLLAVRPDVQARGLGRALLTASIGAASDAGHAAVVLHALAANERALRLYESGGFRPNGVEFPHALTGRTTLTYIAAHAPR